MRLSRLGARRAPVQFASARRECRLALDGERAVIEHAGQPCASLGINHVALEVSDVEEALPWYGRFFELDLRGRAGTAMAFIDIGDEFIAMAAGRSQPPD